MLAFNLLDDAEAADEVVAVTIASAYRAWPAPPTPPGNGPTDRRPFWRDLTADQRAMAALTVLGAHNLDELAVTLGLPVPVVRAEMTGQLVRAADQAGPRD